VSPPPRPMTSPPAGPDAAPAVDEPGQALGADGPETAGTHLGLPRRVRQASLAPQLRDAPPPASADPDTRSPADSRAFMASLQEGWERGRSDAVGEDGNGNADEAGNTGGHPEPAPGSSEREGR
jgi:hypothetical protein